jgi:hypothetical protein
MNAHFSLSPAARRFLYAATALAAAQTGQVATAQESASTDAQAEATMKKDQEAEQLRGARLDNDKKEQELAAARAKAVTDAFPASPTSGKIEGKAGAGKMEASALAAASINAVADDIARDVKLAAVRRNPSPEAGAKGICSPVPLPARTGGTETSSGAAPVLLLAGSGTLSFSHWEQFRFRSCAILKEFQDALGVRATATSSSEVGGFGFAGIGTAVTAASKLLQLVTPDWELGGIELAATDKALLAAVANAYIGSRAADGGAIYWAGQVSKLGGSKEVFDMLGALDALDIAAAKKIDALQPALDAAKKKLAAAKGDEAKRKAQAAVTAAEKAIEPLSTARDNYAQLLKHLNGKAGEALLPINEVVNQAAAETLLGRDGVVLNLGIESVGGGYYSEKAIWNVLGIGGPPYWVSGGVVVSYLAVRPSDQRVVAAGLFSCSAGYVRVNRAAGFANRGMRSTDCTPATP